jgi:hypothetical protein
MHMVSARPYRPIPQTAVSRGSCCCILYIMLLYMQRKALQVAMNLELCQTMAVSEAVAVSNNFGAWRPKGWFAPAVRTDFQRALVRLWQLPTAWCTATRRPLPAATLLFMQL